MFVCSKGLNYSMHTSIINLQYFILNKVSDILIPNIWNMGVRYDEIFVKK